MTWFKVDDSFHSHPKVWASSPAALGLWVVAGSWSSANLSDGFVPDHAVARLLPNAAELAKELVTAGLWRRTKGGYRFRDWLDYNPPAEDVRADRDAARIRMRNLRAKRRAKHEHTGQDVDCSGEQSPNFGRSSGEVPNPDPTRPEGSKEPSKPRKRATQVPDPFDITDDMKDWVRENTPNIDGWKQTQMFVDYYRGKGEARKDWVATWRNWMRKAQQFAENDANRRGEPGARLVDRADARCPTHPRQPANCGVCASERLGATRD